MTDEYQAALRLAQTDDTLTDDDHILFVGGSGVYHVRELRAHSGAQAMHDAYKPHLDALRAAHEEATKSDYERTWQTERTLELEAEAERRAADDPPLRTLSADELKAYRAPDPYAAALAALRARQAFKDAVREAQS
jgi:FMN phosphatase YigB (HAD superfamily)